MLLLGVGMSVLLLKMGIFVDLLCCCCAAGLILEDCVDSVCFPFAASRKLDAVIYMYIYTCNLCVSIY